MSKSNKNGFTLTELLAVIVIMSLIVSIGVPTYINVNKSVKENEYQSKKQYIESLAMEYAADNNVDTTFTVSRLITSGYMSVDEYKDNIPYIANPKNEEDNLACHVISLKLEGYEYYATMLEEKDCDLVLEDVSATSMGISAYEFENNKVGKLIELENNSNSLKWTNKDVLIVFNPVDENIKEINANIFGNSKNINMANMIKEIKEGDTINPSNYSNLIEVRTNLILKEDIYFNMIVNETVKKSNLQVKIDKESPTVNVEKYDGFTAHEKNVLVYITDGNGSGGNGVYLTNTNDFASINSASYYNVSEGQNTIPIGEGLTNGKYYLWGKDNVGNISSVSKEINIENVDDKDPTGTLSISSNNSNYNSRNVTITVTSSDVGIGAESVCISETNYSDEQANSKCSWNNFSKDRYTKSYTFSSSDGSGATHTVYAYIKDGVGNINKYQKSYTLYKMCTNFIRVDGTNCTLKCGGGTLNLLGKDRWFSSSCPQYNLSSGGSACNTQDCCSSVRYVQGTACSAVCNGGKLIGYAYSNYNNQRCASNDAYNQNPCNTQDCCSSVRGTGWGACSVSCGWGTQYQALYSNYDNRYCGTQSQSCYPGACCTPTWQQINSTSKTDGGFTTGKTDNSAISAAKNFIKSNLGYDVSVSCSQSCTKTTWNSDDTRSQYCTVSWASGNYSISGSFYIMIDTNKAGDCKAVATDKHAYVNLSATLYEYKC